MSNPLVPLALVVAQTLSWCAGPLFVCVDGDGSVCVDGGPRDCSCCVVEADHGSACCDEHATRCRGEDACAACGGDANLACTCSLPVAMQDAFDAAPCDCQHQLISAPTMPTLRNASVAVERPDRAPLWSAGAVSAAPRALAATLPASFAVPSDAASPRAFLAAVMLRC